MDIKDIIKEYKNKTHYNNIEIAKELGVTHTTVGRWLNGTVKTVNQETIDKMSEVFHYDVGAILRGTAVSMKRPILGSAKAGYDMFLDNEYLGEEDVSIDDYKAGDYFLKVVGDSMKDVGIIDGGLIYVKHTNLLNNGDIGVFSVDGEVTVKRYYLTKDSIELIAENKDVENRRIDLETLEQRQFYIIGKVLYSKNYV